MNNIPPEARRYINTFMFMDVAISRIGISNALPITCHIPYARLSDDWRHKQRMYDIYFDAVFAPTDAEKLIVCASEDNERACYDLLDRDAEASASSLTWAVLNDNIKLSIELAARIAPAEIDDYTLMRLVALRRGEDSDLMRKLRAEAVKRELMAV